MLYQGASSTNSIVRNSVIGRDPLGNELGNKWNGVFVWGAQESLVQDNIIVNNGKVSSDPVCGVRIQEVSSGAITENYIGTDNNKSNAGNGFDGITLHTNVSNVTISNNVICFNGFDNFAGPGGVVGNGGGIALRNNISNH